MNETSHIPTFAVKKFVVHCDTKIRQKCDPVVMSDADSLGERLRRLRKSKKLPQIEVAEAVGISRSHLAEIEGGKDPGFRTFRDLADYFAVSLDYLESGTKPSPLGDPNHIAKGDDEIALLHFWRGLSPDEKRILKSLIFKDIGIDVA